MLTLCLSSTLSRLQQNHQSRGILAHEYQHTNGAVHLGQTNCNARASGSLPRRVLLPGANCVCKPVDASLAPA
ncbi:hypothetical protein BDV10DRAFT_176445 [Aspergillus recurvatus]